MRPEFSGIERRLDELSERLARLAALAERPRADFDADPFLRDIVERNLEVAAQCCLDIAHRVVALEGALKPRDDYESVLRLGELGVLPAAFAARLAPIAGLRNVLVHGYVAIDWNQIYPLLQNLYDLAEFGRLVRGWLERRSET